MANHGYMSITGKRQGLISAGCSGHWQHYLLLCGLRTISLRRNEFSA